MLPISNRFFYINEGPKVTWSHDGLKGTPKEKSGVAKKKKPKKREKKRRTVFIGQETRLDWYSDWFRFFVVAAASPFSGRAAMIDFYCALHCNRSSHVRRLSRWFRRIFFLLIFLPFLLPEPSPPPKKKRFCESIGHRCDICCAEFSPLECLIVSSLPNCSFISSFDKLI